MDLHKLMIEHLLYPFMERKRGNQIRKMLAELQASEKLDAVALSAQQKASLTALLQHCRQNVPAYQQASWTDDNLAADPVSCLRSIAPLSKANFQANSEMHLATNIPESQRIANRTGGSTGQPVHFFMNRPQVESYEAARWRGLSWFGITPGSRSIMVWGNPLKLDQAAQKKYLLKEQHLKNRKIIPAYSLSEQNIPDYIRLINRYKPEYLYGYSSSLYAFAQMLEPHGGEITCKLKAVVSTSETLHDWQAELLQKVFRCPVANEYGARDAGILAFHCPCGKLHITAENACIEVLDPVTHEPLKAGQAGVLAVTDLHNYIQPRLRYLLGDVGAIGTGPCACGLALPTLASLEGREDALFVIKDGKLVHGHIVAHVIRQYTAIRQFQFIQHTPEQATLKVVMEPDDTLLAQIVDEISAVLPGIRIRTEYVDSIPLSGSGKLRYAIREFPLQAKQ